MNEGCKNPEISVTAAHLPFLRARHIEIDQQTNRFTGDDRTGKAIGAERISKHAARGCKSPAALKG